MSERLVTQEVLSAFITVLGSSVVLCALPPQGTTETCPQLFLAAVRNRHRALVEEVDDLALEDEAELQRLIDMLHQAVELGTSVLLPHTTTEDN